jgi:Mrp family chromosome partitioning ATPase
MARSTVADVDTSPADAPEEAHEEATDEQRSDGTETEPPRGVTPAPRQMLDQLRYLVNSRELTGEAPLPQSIALTSSMRGEGVTTVSRAFAVVLTEDHDANVCWVDLSWAGTDGSDDAVDDATPPGIADVLGGAARLDDAITVDPTTGVSELTAGSARYRSTISYRSAQLDATVGALAAEFDYLVFDMPPVLESSTALPLFRLAGAYLFVVRAGVTRRDQAARSTRQLAEVPLLGTVLNRQRSKIPAFLRRIGSD